MTSSAIALVRKQLLKRSRELSRKSGKKSQADDIWAALEPSERLELESLHRTLERIGRGIYGTCVECQVEFDEITLSASPMLEKCEDCSIPERTNTEHPSITHSSEHLVA